MDNTVLRANYTMPPFLHKRSPDGTTHNWGSRHPVAAYYLFVDREGMKSVVGLVVDL